MGQRRRGVWLQTTTADLASSVEHGTADPAFIRALGMNVIGVWLACLDLFVTAACVGLFVAHHAHRCLTLRLERIAEYGRQHRRWVAGCAAVGSVG